MQQQVDIPESGIEEWVASSETDVGPETIARAKCQQAANYTARRLQRQFAPLLAVVAMQAARITPVCQMPLQRKRACRTPKSSRSRNMRRKPRAHCPHAGSHELVSGRKCGLAVGGLELPRATPADEKQLSLG